MQNMQWQPAGNPWQMMPKRVWLPQMKPQKQPVTTAEPTTTTTTTTTTTEEPVTDRPNKPKKHKYLQYRPKNKCPSGARRPVRGNEDAFEVCDNGEWRFMLCAPGTWFEAEFMECTDGEKRNAHKP